MCATPYAGGCGGRVLLLNVLDVKMMRCVLLRTLEAAEGALCLLEVPEVMHVRYSVRWRLWRVGSVAGRVGCACAGGAGDDALCATPYARGCGGCALFDGGVGGAGGAGGDALCAARGSVRWRLGRAGFASGFQKMLPGSAGEMRDYRGVAAPH